MSIERYIERYVRALPKAELHLHLEGSMQPETLLRLARLHGVALPADDLAGLRRWFRFSSFDHFIQVYTAINSSLKEREDFELLTVQLGEELARQNVRYAEVTYSVAPHTRRGVPFEQSFAGLCRGRERVRKELGVEINWVFDLMHNTSREDWRSGCDETLACAIDGTGQGVVALGLGGDERDGQTAAFAPWFERAGEAGLHAAPHAGELCGPESVRQAIAALGAERIGHGVRAIEDPALLAELKRRGIALEVCPTSNVCLGVCAGYAGHALPALLAAGVPLNIGSDDPPLFNTTLTDELLLLHRAFGLGVEQIDELVLNAVRHSFLPVPRRAALEAEFRAEMVRLRAELLGP
ncbi:MAG TPA: adenosine deaminase [Dehalococcoidia bacterium]|nr:adenosine deaminase [Dehalococcoidia bacterium]